jgi:ABC-type transport system involved in cytochrome c biogenesis permease component
LCFSGVLFHHPPVLTGPFIERELRVAWRRQNPTKLRFWLAVGGIAVSLFFMWFNPSRGKNALGSELHKLLFWAGIILIFQVPRTTAGLFAEERRNDTLGLLFLCGIRPGELFVGKLLGVALIAYTHLLGLFPFLAIAFLVGGVSIKLFTATLVCLPLLLLFAFAVSTLASVLTDDDSAALFVALLLGGVICLATPVVFWANGSFSDVQTLSRDWLALSPAFPAYVVASGLGGGTPAQFWTGCAMTLIWSLICLGAAGAIMTRSWRDRPDGAAGASWRTRWQACWHGDFAWRRRLAARWLDSHPFAWLAARDRRLVNLAWLVIGALMALWLAACWCWPRHWPGTLNFLLTSIVLNLALRWVTLFAAAKTISHHRNEGSLELLLTTPLKEADIVEGQLLALRNQFRPVALAVIGIELVMMLAGFLIRDWTLAAGVVYGLIWCAIVGWMASYAGSYRFALTSFWDGLVCGRPVFVAWRLSGFSISPLWLGWMFLVFGRSLKSIRGLGGQHFPEGNITEIILLLVGGLLVVTSSLAWRREHRLREQRLLTEMRSLATEPLPETSDPRFKEWKSGERFPESLQHQLVKRTLQRAQRDKASAR